MKHGFYTFIATTMLVSGLALATPAAAQWNGQDHSGSRDNGDHMAPMETHHEMHKDKHDMKHKHHGHKHHHHKHHDDKKDEGANH